MAQVDRTVVAAFPIFGGLRPVNLDSVIEEARLARYPKGTDVFRQDEEARSFFVLFGGHLRVIKLTPDGRQIVVRFVNPGEIFGVAMAIGRTSYPATATAVVDSAALVWASAASGRASSASIPPSPPTL